MSSHHQATGAQVRWPQMSYFLTLSCGNSTLWETPLGDLEVLGLPFVSLWNSMPHFAKLLVSVLGYFFTSWAVYIFPHGQAQNQGASVAVLLHSEKTNNYANKKLEWCICLKILLFDLFESFCAIEGCKFSSVPDVQSKRRSKNKNA